MPGSLPMTQSITQIFSSGRGVHGGADDGGYAKPLGEPPGGIGGSGDGFGADFAKVDFDKPLFGGRIDSSEGEQGRFAVRSQYSSSPKPMGTGQEHPAQQKLGLKETAGGAHQALRTDMPLASEMGKRQQSLQKQSGHDFK